MSDKIKRYHLGRKTILYVPAIVAPPSDAQSRKPASAIRDRLRALGWREIEVVDDEISAPRLFSLSWRLPTDGG